MTPAPLFHIARVVEWQAAQRDGAYRISTLGRHLEDQGYIHLSFAPQVKSVADRVYRGLDDLLLLEIDPARLSAPVAVEAGEGTSERFPHLYGELNVDAVVRVSAYRADEGGSFPPVEESGRADFRS